MWMRLCVSTHFLHVSGVKITVSYCFGHKIKSVTSILFQISQEIWRALVWSLQHVERKISLDALQTVPGFTTIAKLGNRLTWRPNSFLPVQQWHTVALQVCFLFFVSLRLCYYCSRNNPTPSPCRAINMCHCHFHAATALLVYSICESILLLCHIYNTLIVPYTSWCRWSSQEHHMHVDIFWSGLFLYRPSEQKSHIFSFYDLIFHFKTT